MIDLWKYEKGGWGYDDAPNQWKRGKWMMSVAIHGASKIFETRGLDINRL